MFSIFQILFFTYYIIGKYTVHIQVQLLTFLIPEWISWMTDSMTLKYCQCSATKSATLLTDNDNLCQSPRVLSYTRHKARRKWFLLVSAPDAVIIFTHEQLCFLSGEAFRLSACKFCCINSESATAKAQQALKGNGRWDSDWFIACYAQNTPITP